MSEEIKKGQVTNLPIPRYVSLKVKEANARRGPSLSHKIDWIYKRKNMPLEIYGEYENWRRVRDFEGLGGWVHYTLLSGIRFVLVKNELFLPIAFYPQIIIAESRCLRYICFYLRSNFV